VQEVGERDEQGLIGLKAEHYASRMPLLRGQQSRESNALPIALSLGNGMTNSIRPLSVQESICPTIPSARVQKLNTSAARR
jgi:hypothetical protein